MEHSYEEADIQAEKKGYPFSATGMYQCEEYAEFDEEGNGVVVLERVNICGICLFIEDEPYNYGDVIKPTSYDGDCDDCGRDSRFYVERLKEE